MAPDAINSIIDLINGMNRVHIASIKKAPDSREAAIISLTCLADNAIGFSQSTAFPCFKQRIACSA